MSVRGIVSFISAVALAIALCMPDIAGRFPFWALALAAHYAEMLFHELGHAVFWWAFGTPAIPAIFTVFGNDQAGGMTLTFGHSWAVQIAAWAGMTYGIWWLVRAEALLWAVTAGVVAMALFLCSFWAHHALIPLYMGHGSTMIVGCFFLYRGVLKWVGVERWLNLFLGSYLLISNGRFAWNLAFDAGARAEYSGRSIFGVTHHDFMAMQEEWARLSVESIAMGTLAAIIVGLAITLTLAYRQHAEHAEWK